MRTKTAPAGRDIYLFFLHHKFGHSISTSVQTFSLKHKLISFLVPNEVGTLLSHYSIIHRRWQASKPAIRKTPLRVPPPAISRPRTTERPYFIFFVII